jgi:hypothetical protein
MNSSGTLISALGQSCHFAAALIFWFFFIKKKEHKNLAFSAWKN